VRQILLNIILNAIKFGKPGQVNEISIFSRDGDGETWYCVRDSGIGFDMQYAERIFEAFLQLNPEETHKGTGIGLAIVKRIILRHNGQIRVISREGAGSEFSFTLKT
jgi:signal transduction histidine kinase